MAGAHFITEYKCLHGFDPFKTKSMDIIKVFIAKYETGEEKVVCNEIEDYIINLGREGCVYMSDNS